MIDEIPERDPLPNKSQARPLSLSHLAILLTLVFLVLLVMFWGSRALDSLAAKLWPSPMDPNIEVAVDKTAAAISRTAVNISKSSNSASNSGPIPIPLQSNQTNLAGQQNFLNQQAALKEQQGKQSSSKASNQATPESALVASASLFGRGDAKDARTKEATVEKAIAVTPLAKANKLENKTGPEALQPITPTKENSAGLANLRNPNPEDTNLNALNNELKTVTDANLDLASDLTAANSIETSLKTASEAVKREKEQRRLQALQSVKQPLKAEGAKQYSASEKEILKNDPRHYTVQILGMHNKNKLQSFMNEAKLKGKVRYCRGNHQGKPWYILVYGEYATREEAQKVMAALPEEVKKQKPWVRSFASLQGTLHARE